MATLLLLSPTRPHQLRLVPPQAPDARVLTCRRSQVQLNPAQPCLPLPVAPCRHPRPHQPTSPQGCLLHRLPFAPTHLCTPSQARPRLASLHHRTSSMRPASIHQSTQTSHLYAHPGYALATAASIFPPRLLLHRPRRDHHQLLSPWPPSREPNSRSFTSPSQPPRHLAPLQLCPLVNCCHLNVNKRLQTRQRSELRFVLPHPPKQQHPLPRSDARHLFKTRRNHPPSTHQGDRRLQ